MGRPTARHCAKGESLNQRIPRGSSPWRLGNPWEKKREDCRSKRIEGTREDDPLNLLSRAHVSTDTDVCVGLCQVLCIEVTAVNLVLLWDSYQWEQVFL